MKDKEYALYKGESCLELGTVNQIAKAMKVKPQTIMFYATPTYQKRNKGQNKRVLICLDEGDE